MRIYSVCLEGMEFRAYHGCLESEKLNGNLFKVSLTAKYESNCACTDDIADAVDYGMIFKVVEKVMNGERVNLLETLADRIVKGVSEQFPTLFDINVTVSKMNPPVDGICKCSSVGTHND